MRRIIANLNFALYLWRCVKYDGTGHKISLWYALGLAFDRSFWRV